MRTVVSYDDITLPYQDGPSTSPSTNPPPSKKRKWSNQKSKQPSQPRRREFKVSTNDDNHGPDTGPSMLNGEEGGKQDDDSRELTYDEIWDDSALINAWNAATEEYEAYNGPDKDWKTEPVHQSPLWYNVPPTPSKQTSTEKDSAHSLPPTAVRSEEAMGDMQDDSQPLNFDTYVPTHDPSLNIPVLPRPSFQGPNYTPRYAQRPTGSRVSQDEAFARAMEAMYWTGYWTAMYHKNAPDTSIDVIEEKGEDEYEGDEEDEEIEGEEEEEELYVSTQR